MNIEEMATEYLKSSEFDGLYNEVAECGCSKNDLAPCGDLEMDCVGAYKNKCSVCSMGTYSPEKGIVTCRDCIESLESLG